eukprot:g20854.t1
MVIGGIIVTLEEAQDGHATQGVSRGVKMVGDWKVLFVAYRAQMLYEMFYEYVLGLTDAEEATLDAADAVDQVEGCVGECLSNAEGGHLGCSGMEHPILGADAAEVEELGVGDRILAGMWVRG